MNTATIDLTPESPDKALATGVLKQAAADLRRFHNATSKVERELYRDVYSWLTADDFTWPYSFVNVCALLNLCPDLTRADLLEDISLDAFSYWNKLGRGLFRTMKAALTQKIAGSSTPANPAAGSATAGAGYIYQ